MKVAFLDFDGVLNSQEFSREAEASFTEVCPGPPPPHYSVAKFADKLETWLEQCKRSPEYQAFLYRKDLTCLDPRNVAHLNTIVERSGCVVCISSAWRVGTPVTRLASLLHDRGFLYPEKIVGKTGGGYGGHRGEQIKSWLRDSAEPVEGLVVIDDEDRLEPFEKEWQVKPSFYDVGLTAEHAEQAIRILDRKFSYEEHTRPSPERT